MMNQVVSKPGRRILLLHRMTPNVAEVAAKLLPEGFSLEIFDERGPERELEARLRQADFLIGFSQRPWPTSLYDAAADLKLIQLVSAGYDRLDLKEVRRIGVPVSNNGGANSVAVAEQAIMLMLAIHRRLVWLDASVRRGNWKPPEFLESPEFEGQLVGIVGMGMIGRQVARKVRGLGARAQYFDILRLPAEQEAGLGLTFVPLDDLLRTSDVVTLHLPLTEKTRTLIGTRELDLDEAVRHPDQHRPRTGGGRTRAIPGTGERYHRRSGAGCAGEGTARS